jgi:transposase
MAGVVCKPYIIDTGYLFPPSLADFLGTDDEVHVFREVTEHLDVSHLDSDFNGMGQHPYHPLMLLRLLMWGMANRVVSTRRIEVLTHRDVSFIYLAGGQRPDYRTLARFRRRNTGEIKRLFKQTVLYCARLGMVNLGHLSLDGTKLKANTSKHKAMSYGRMKQEEQRLEGEIEELMLQAEAVDSEEDKAFGKDNNGYNLPDELRRREERLNKIRGLRQELEQEKREEQGLDDGETPLIKDKEQRSFADRKARMMLMKRGEFDYGYNAQACTEESHGIIMVADLTNDPADTENLPQIVEEVRELRQELGFSAEGGKQTQISADSGYFSADNIKAEGGGIELLIASGREKKGEEKESRDSWVYSLKRFCYDREDDVWLCPEGQLLRQEAVQTDGRYRYVCQDCAGCKLRVRCLKTGEDRRMLVVEESQLLLGEMRARLKKPEKHAVYRKRKWVAEQPIGQIKEGLGFRGVTMRGDDYARGQWRFVCAVHNVMKAVRFIVSSRKSVEMEAIASTA